MGKKFLVLGILLLGVIAGSAPALAYNQQLTIYASVPPMRAIYLDASGNIIKVGGNTADNVTPQVYNDKNQPVDMTASVQTQYQQFLQSYNGHISAGKIYQVNPVRVNLATVNQVIQLNTAPAQLTLSL
jgi:hypothetical protein